MRLLAALLLGAAVATAFAQNYPSRPVRLVVPLSPGGFADTPTRILAPRLSEQLGRQFYVENRPGAGGTIGWDFVAKSAPDGYTLGITGSTLLIGAHLYKNAPYDALKDFTHITMMASGPYVLVVNPHKVPANSVRELIAAAKAQPGAIDFASSGNGSSQHLVGALFNMMAGTQLNHVPYKGSGPAMQDLLGGRIDFLCDILNTAKPQIDAGAVKAIAIMTKVRSPALPNVPTGLEQGTAGLEAYTWSAIFLPKGAPAAIVKKLNGAVVQTIKTADVRKRLEGLGAEVVNEDHATPEYLGKFVKSEIDKWAGPIKKSGVTVD
jgi:tripartite-type tricarboxylate transporter receptor subunit TctC